MNELASKLIKLKPAQKVGATFLAVFIVAGLYYQLFYADLSDAIAAAESQQRSLREEKATYEKRRIEYLAYRNELKQLQEEQRDLLRVLPKRDEMASFLSSIQEQAELAGLEIPVFSPDSEVPEDLYVRIPVRMEVKGGFHAITKFFKNLSEMRRIVTVEDLSFVPEGPDKNSVNNGTRLKARFVAVTYRSVDVPDPAGATAKAGK
ncbi:MAG TPA: type 4a pilus biogenesis protein PilO [Polyangia bacterium]